MISFLLKSTGKIQFSFSSSLWSDFCFSRSLLRLLAAAVKSLHVLLVLYPERLYGRAVSVSVFCCNLPSLQWAYLQGNLFSNECDTPTLSKKKCSLFSHRMMPARVVHVISVSCGEPSCRAFFCLCKHKHLKWCSTQNTWFGIKRSPPAGTKSGFKSL